jgi:hypothetical protein
MTIPPPKIIEGYPERALDCQLAMEPTFQDLARHAEVAGWSEDEVSAGLLELARDHIKGIIADRRAAADIVAARDSEI